MTNYTVHPSAIVDEGAQIGEGSRIWHFVHVCGGAKIGKGVSLGQNVFVGNKVVIGDKCKVAKPANSTKLPTALRATKFSTFGDSSSLFVRSTPPTSSARKSSIWVTKIE